MHPIDMAMKALYSATTRHKIRNITEKEGRGDLQLHTMGDGVAHGVDSRPPPRHNGIRTGKKYEFMMGDVVPTMIAADDIQGPDHGEEKFRRLFDEHHIQRARDMELAIAMGHPDAPGSVKKMGKWHNYFTGTGSAYDPSHRAFMYGARESVGAGNDNKKLVPGKRRGGGPALFHDTNQRVQHGSNYLAVDRYLR